MSVDYRLSNSSTREALPQLAIKYVNVQFLPIFGGPRALFTFAGLGQASDGTPTGQWLRETMRGMTQDYSEEMNHLRGRLDRDFGRLGRQGHELIINIALIHEGRRYFGALSNKYSDGTVTGTFGYGITELDDDWFWANGSGAPWVPRDGHNIRLQRALSTTPRAPSDYLGLLAKINREVATKEKTVSAFCQAVFLPAEGDVGTSSRAFYEPSESVPFEVPLLLGPIDTTQMSSALNDYHTEFVAGRPAVFDPGDDSSAVRRRP